MLELILEIIVGIVSAMSAWRLLLSVAIGVMLAILVHQLFANRGIAVGAGLTFVCVGAVVGMRWQRFHERKGQQH